MNKDQLKFQIVRVVLQACSKENPRVVTSRVTQSVASGLFVERVNVLVG